MSKVFQDIESKESPLWMKEYGDIGEVFVEATKSLLRRDSFEEALLNARNINKPQLHLRAPVVGALIGALHGISGLPQNAVEHIYNIKQG